ncbi:phosphate signaling complex protein PhoU [Erysipelothrix sp. HDW6C]|uniref:phosphate signaling complex protein PhoU n=1 Tax=Erysipelothrix sp. HDW6C TaxID=2714930 RepID=UPI00140A438F|nr:phosphate signaling complex protein PhoU [Erysipelothrix sp. HDW6C]QIK70170.1 phosphate signaling complex protein PhoU [Erysipelothrix sp. HDW6C]
MRIEDRMIEFESELFDMAARVRRSMALAIEALKEDDKEKALQIIEKDEYINDMDESINDLAIQTLSLMQPVAKDLRLLVGGIKIATDLERIGDYAKNIGRFVVKNHIEKDFLNDEITELGNIFLGNFDEVLNVLKTQDIKKAYEAAELDDNLDQAFKKVMHKFVDDAEKQGKFPIEITAILRNIERAGDHAKNICEQVIYIAKGQHVDFG